MSARSGGRSGNLLPLVVALHGRGQDAAAGLALARRLFGDGPPVVALQAARPCNPFQSNLRANPAYSGFSWYLGDDPARPEAASFGDALAQVDAFVRTLEVPFVLCGEGQGAVLARTLGLYDPPGLVGVLAPAAKVPEIAGWEAPLRSASGGDRVFDEGTDGPAWLQSLADSSRIGAHA